MVMLLKFDDNLKTGVPQMDEEHETLINLLNRVSMLLKSGEKAKAVDFFKNTIASYVETHLNNEEAFMESIEYPHLEEHRKIHEVFRREVHKLLPAIESGDYHAFTQALSLCWGWLYNHIAKTDKKYGEYAREKGLI